MLGLFNQLFGLFFLQLLLLGLFEELFADFAPETSELNVIFDPEALGYLDPLLYFRVFDKDLIEFPHHLGIIVVHVVVVSLVYLGGTEQVS